MLCLVQPLSGMFDAGDRRQSAPKHMSRAPRSEFECSTASRQNGRNLLQELAAQLRKDPSRHHHIYTAIMFALVFSNQPFELRFERDGDGS